MIRPSTLTTLLLIAASLPGLAPAAAANDREPKEVAAVLDAFVAAIRQADSEQIGALYATDAHFEDVTLGTRYDGRAAIEQSWFTLFSAHLEPPRIEVARRVAVPGQGVLELVYRGRIDGALLGAPGTSRDYEISMVALLDVAEGRIVRQTDYLDLDRYRDLLAPAPTDSATTPSR